MENLNSHIIDVGHGQTLNTKTNIWTFPDGTEIQTYTPEETCSPEAAKAVREGAQRYYDILHGNIQD